MKTSDSKYAQCLYFTANALARKTEKLASKSWAKVDLTPSHAYLLMLVIDQPGIQPTIISAQLQLTPSTVTRLITKLEAKKLVIRLVEGKTTGVYPSTKGKALLPQLNKCRDEFYSNCLKLFMEEENNKLVKNMGRAADKLED